MTRILGTLHEDQNTFMVVSPSVLLRMRNVSKIVEKIKTDSLRSITTFSKIVPLTGKNTVQPGRPDNNMAHAHCMMDT